jgi:hypothetical protein
LLVLIPRTPYSTTPSTLKIRQWRWTNHLSRLTNGNGGSPPYSSNPFLPGFIHRWEGSLESRWMFTPVGNRTNYWTTVDWKVDRRCPLGNGTNYQTLHRDMMLTRSLQNSPTTLPPTSQTKQLPAFHNQIPKMPETKKKNKSDTVGRTTPARLSIRLLVKSSALSVEDSAAIMESIQGGYQATIAEWH